MAARDEETDVRAGALVGSRGSDVGVHCRHSVVETVSIRKWYPVFTMSFRAQVFTLSKNGDRFVWDNITDGATQLVLICEEEKPRHVYRVTTFDPELQGFIQGYIILPETHLAKRSKKFIQWKDPEQGVVWGLYFTLPEELEKFVELCVPTREETQVASDSLQLLLSVELPTGLQTVDDQGNTSTNHSPAMVNGRKDGSRPGQTGLFSTLALPDKKTDSVPVSGSVRKAIANRKDQRKLKYATYSGKNREALQRSYYENMDTEDGKSEDFDDSTLKASKSKPSRHGSHPELDIASSSPSADEHHELVRQLSGSPGRGSGYLSASQMDAGINNGVLKSAKFVAANAQNFKTANSVSQITPTTPEKELKNDRKSGIRTRLKVEGQSFFGRGNKTKTKNKAKRSTSFSEKFFTRVHVKDNANKNSLDEAQRVLEETNSLLQAYEVHLQMQTLDETIDGLPSTGDDRSVASKSSCGTASDIPKWKKRLSEGITSGSECSSLSHHGDGSTLTSSETMSKGDQDLQEFFYHDEEDMEEEEDGEEDGDSHSLSSHHTHASMFQQRGAIRKAGWLHVKSMLVQRKKRVERPGKRSWKKYWVCLKGTMLLFHAPSDRETDESSEPRHILVVENGLAQAVPEHPKRENIFCLSTAFGDSYFLQAPNQIELENWTIAIHSACSSAFTRQHGKEETLRLLRLETHKLEDKIELETKTKKMAELQLSTVSDPKNRQAIASQILQWDQNLESLHLELYRIKCYSSSLQATELPNPKTLLACVSKTTKATLSRLGYFNVSSFHALVCARNPMGLEGRFIAKPKNKKQNGLFGTLKRNKKKLHAQLSQDKKEDTDGGAEEVEPVVDTPQPYAVSFSMDEGELESIESSTSDHSVECMAVKVSLPEHQSSMVTLKPEMTVQDLLAQCCMNRQMDVGNFYVRFKISLKAGANFIIPDKSAVLEHEKFDEIEICAKSIHQIELCKFTEEMDFGFSVEAELMEDSEEDDQLCVFVSKVEKGALAYLHDLQVGDELLVINSRVVCDLDMLFIENLLRTASNITLTIRSCRSVFAQTQAMLDTNSFINSMTCPPPPSQSRLTDDIIDNLIIPAPLSYDVTPTISPEGTPVKQLLESKENNNIAVKTPQRESTDLTALMKNAEKITELCRTYSSEDERRMSSKLNGVNPSEDQQSANKLRKVIFELLDTERAYVKDIECLLSRYLEPLQEEAFLSADEVDALFGNVKEIIKFQVTFLKCLEDASNVGGNLEQLSSPPEFKRVIFSIGGCFLYYMDHFKLYSSFCACHSRAQKILDPSRGNTALMEFLAARNPKQQHSASLASYLIKPIQRVLKYPLLLQEIYGNLDKESTEQFHIGEALRGMENVAEHINDMMRVHEEFGDVFDSLVAEQYHVKQENIGNKVSDLAMDDLLYYSYVTWQNASDDVGKVKKGREPRIILFVFRLAMVIIYKDAVRRKSRSAKMIGTNEETIKFKWMIPVSSLQVKDTSISGSTEFQGMFELVHLKDEGKPEKTFQLICESQDTRQTFIKTIRQVTRDYLRGKNNPGSSKYAYLRSKTYVAYGGKRLEALGRSKRTLRKNFGTSVSSGRSEASSLGSEERSSESGSLQDKSDLDRYETDSVSTGKESVGRDEGEKLFYDRKINLELNSNGNNSSVVVGLDARLTNNNVASIEEEVEEEVFGEETDCKRPSLKAFLEENRERNDSQTEEKEAVA
ncbi:protein still life, isoforms C/SIF type 2-like isoform X3 [Apostichopus japonicus]|uniref:protein still life, isoforms C/SIF type 2-like isoform X3 n=1 Tax=Stichopus japonicus TaxID=307972 RepID=UPI003AB35558